MEPYTRIAPLFSTYFLPIRLSVLVTWPLFKVGTKMKTIGFPISYKENESRRAIIPKHIAMMHAPQSLFFEHGYGKAIGLVDSEYENLGCRMCTRSEALEQDVICEVKVGEGGYLESLHRGQTVFGWIHAVQSRGITEALVRNGLTGYAWENMFSKNRNVFWRNNEIAGEAAILHSFQCYGRMPYQTNVAVIGRGNTARGAMRMLNMLGADVTQYGRNDEAVLRSELHAYDVLVNCVLWDEERKDHIISRQDLKLMKRNSMIVDVSCDEHGAIESSHPTTISNPVFYDSGVLHYVVDHTPALFGKTSSEAVSEAAFEYLDCLALEQSNDTLEQSLAVRDGIILDPEITRYQDR